MENIYFRRPYSIQQEETAFHLRDPESGIILGAEPFCFNGKNGDAVLLIHGYTSTPRDLRALGSVIHNAGYTASGILLPGHGTKPTDLDNIKWQTWFSSVQDEYLRLSRQHEHVHAIGFSMGGTLAMHLATHFRVEKLVLLSPFFKIAYHAAHTLHTTSTITHTPGPPHY
ncbi:MAG: alpha/beta fold hydrolase, partial [Candidatus Mariimomonas ferrooxydans]